MGELIKRQDDMHVVAKAYRCESERMTALQELPVAEGRYTLDQIVDAMVQADGVIILAIKHQDREWVKDVLNDHL